MEGVNAEGNVGRGWVNRHFHALSHRNFRYMWMGQCVSMMGTWMQSVAQSWLVLSLTNSSLLLGLVGAAQFLPVTCLSLFAGAMIDKMQKKRILLVTQTVSMLLAFLLAALVFTHEVRYGYVLATAFVLGICNAFDMPTRQSFTIELVGKEDLMNAISLNSMVFNLARIVGPSIGAVLMAAFGVGWCFLLNGLSFLAVLYGLLRIEAVSYVRRKSSEQGILKEVADGLRYIAADKSLAQALLLVTIVGTLSYNHSVLIPAFTRDVLHEKETMFGALMSCVGFGSFFGALGMSLRKKGPSLSLSFIGGIIVAAVLVLNGLADRPVLSGAMLVLLGLFNIIFMNNSNSFIQVNAKQEYRTRVMSVYTLVFAGSTPVGNLLTGYASDRTGPGGAYMICGLLTLLPLAGVWLLYRFKK